MVNVSTVKPLDIQGILDIVKNIRCVVTAEEHTIIGGLGSAVTEALAGYVQAPVQYVGVKDSFGTSAHSYDDLLKQYGLMETDIMRAVKNGLKK